MRKTSSIHKLLHHADLWVSECSHHCMNFDLQRKCPAVKEKKSFLVPQMWRTRGARHRHPAKKNSPTAPPHMFSVKASPVPCLTPRRTFIRALGQRVQWPVAQGSQQGPVSRTRPFSPPLAALSSPHGFRSPAALWPLVQPATSQAPRLLLAPPTKTPPKPDRRRTNPVFRALCSIIAKWPHGVETGAWTLQSSRRPATCSRAASNDHVRWSACDVSMLQYDIFMANCSIFHKSIRFFMTLFYIINTMTSLWRFIIFSVSHYF